MGSSYAGSGVNDGTKNPGLSKAAQRGGPIKRPYFGGKRPNQLPYINVKFKPKDLIPIPWMLAMALQADGWWLRSCMPWVKRSAMPESVTDRPASALEYVFLLSTSQKYFFDMEAIKKKAAYPNGPNSPGCIKSPYGQSFTRNAPLISDNRKELHGPTYSRHRLSIPGGQSLTNKIGRNFRNTDLYYESIKPPHGIIFAGDEPVGLDVNPQPFKEAHFATFPPKLITPAIKAGSSEHGCCAECGKPWKRVVKKEYGEDTSSTNHIAGGDRTIGQGWEGTQRRAEVKTQTLGWQPTCKCKTKDRILAKILDPFFGSGTTGLVAEKYNRAWVGIELSEDYSAIAKDRLERATQQFNLFSPLKQETS